VLSGIQRFCFIALAFAAFGSTACKQSDGSSTNEVKKPAHGTEDARQSQEWIAQEVLLQLKEMRADISSMKAEVTKLREQVEGLSAGVGNEGAAAPSVASLDLKDVPVIGKSAANVGIVEFSDFECPYCGRHNKQVFTEIKREFIDNGKIKYYSRQYPLPFHSSARGAAIAALCADKQGKYWEMREALFGNQKDLGDSLYQSSAKDIGMNAKQFALCSADKKIASQLDADARYGDSVGVSGTPKFFVGKIVKGELTNVTVIDGAQPYQRFAAVINSKLSSN